MRKFAKYLNLQRLIVGLAILAAGVMLANAVFAAYQVQRQQLIDNALESNRVYAHKLAQTTHNFLISSQQQLEYSARSIARSGINPDAVREEAHRLQSQTNAFNSVIVVNEQGRVTASSPTLREIDGQALSSLANSLAIASRAPLVSNPYISATGKLVLTISQPIFDATGAYRGYISASIHLKEPNVLHSLLGTHYYRDGSYLYVVGQDGKLLYHPEPNRVGDSALKNEVVRAVSRGESGAMPTTNSHGIHMLAGYAPIPAAHWGIVSQRPVDATLQPLTHLMNTVLLNAAPLGVLCLLLIWIVSRRISKPLWQLASTAQNSDVSQAILTVTAVDTWYYEANELQKAVLTSFNAFNDRMDRLDQAALTDPLTGLLNRRGLERALDHLSSSRGRFAIIALDIDHFKRVNDRHGHDVGDGVIAGVAELMRQNSRAEDVLCRIGGEEFLLLLPDVSEETAAFVAHRLRKSIQEKCFPIVGSITASMGVSHFPETHTDPDHAIRQADKALYKAKEEGRNRVVSYRRRKTAL